jgi:hypothetical protein
MAVAENPDSQAADSKVINIRDQWDIGAWKEIAKYLTKPWAMVTWDVDHVPMGCVFGRREFKVSAG